MNHWPYFNQTPGGKELLVRLINESNPSLAWSPLTLDTVRLGRVTSQPTDPKTHADTALEVYPVAETNYTGKTHVHYRRIDLGQLFSTHVVEITEWHSSYIHSDDIVAHLNTHYGLVLQPGELGNYNHTPSLPWGLIRRSVSVDSICYQGTLTFRWLRGKRPLPEIIPSEVINARRWSPIDGASTTTRPLMSLVGYGHDWSGFSPSMDAFTTITLTDRLLWANQLIRRYNALYDTELNTAVNHTETNGLAGLTFSNHTLPDTVVPEANADRYTKALVITSRSDSWFSGRVIFHYAPRQPVVSRTGHGPTELLYDNDDDGYYGEVTESEFLTTGQLMEHLHLSGPTERRLYGWLKFKLGERTVLIPRNPPAVNVSWRELREMGLVHGTDPIHPNDDPRYVPQNRHITVDGAIYRVRLIQGSDSDPYVSNGGEWDRTLQRLIPGGQWYTHTTAYVQPTGLRQFCVETTPDGTQTVARIVGGNLSFNELVSVDRKDSSLGWRPLLELVSVPDDFTQAPTDWVEGFSQDVLIKAPALTGHRNHDWLDTHVVMTSEPVNYPVPPVLNHHRTHLELTPVSDIESRTNLPYPPAITGYTYTPEEP